MKKLVSLLLTLVILVVPFSLISYAEDAPFSNSSFYASGDYTIHYRTYEAADEKGQILLLHGFGLSTESLDPIAKEYQNNGFKVITVDLPNFGYSSRENFSTKLQSREDLVYQLMQYLGGSWNIGGHSMGGGIAINVAASHPEIINSLLLFAPQSSAQGNNKSDALLKIQAGLFESILTVGSKIPALMKLIAAYSFSDFKFVKNYDISKISKPLSKSGTGTGIAIMTSHTLKTNLAELSSFNKPICIITSDNDKIARKDNLTSIIQSAGGNASVFSVKEGGHMFIEYNAKESAALTFDTIVR